MRNPQVGDMIVAADMMIIVEGVVEEDTMMEVSDNAWVLLWVI